MAAIYLKKQMSEREFNKLILLAKDSSSLQARLKECSPEEVVEIAKSHGFDIVIADLIRYKCRSTSWKLSDNEMAVVYYWNPDKLSYWWNYIWET